MLRQGFGDRVLPAIHRAAALAGLMIGADVAPSSAFYGRLYAVMFDMNQTGCMTASTWSCAQWDASWSNTCNWDVWLATSDDGGFTWAPAVNLTAAEGKEMVRHVLDFYLTEFTARERAEMDPLVHAWLGHLGAFDNGMIVPALCHLHRLTDETVRQSAASGEFGDQLLVCGVPCRVHGSAERHGSTGRKGAQLPGVPRKADDHRLTHRTPPCTVSS